MTRYGMVIDVDRCMGCRACMMACKIENNTSQGMFWMYVFRQEEGKYPNVNVKYMPRPCMHCDDAPCAKVCPVGARFHREDGLILTDRERCIGCRYCMAACPYGVNYFNWKEPSGNFYHKWTVGEGDLNGSGGIPNGYVEGNIPPYKNPDHDKLYNGRPVSGGGRAVGVMEKCTFCVHRVEKAKEKGEEPTTACQATCPVNVIHFGDLDDPNSEVSRLLLEKPSFRLLEELGTEPNVYYLGTPPLNEKSRNLVMR